ncbi:MAG: glycosyltransferase family 2 protein [Clostridia bacterium]|nr:glycosyltransferase family 2 protein [Clostridia bacterium]
MPILYIVIPCYNEQEVIGETTRRLLIKLEEMIISGKCSDKSRILYVDDGSKDKTWELITRIFSQNERVCGLKLAHNRGHQNALYAGLMTARNFADCVISMDADLQDDINVMDDFLDKFNDGCDIVYGVRSNRDTDTKFKKFTAQSFYKVMKFLGVETVYNHADYRLMSKRALDALAQYDEVNLYLRGIVPDLGFKSDCVYYERGERYAGETKYPLKKMIGLATQGITSFSVKPLTMVSGLGLIISALSALALLISLIAGICGAYVTIAVILSTIWLACGIITTSLGIVGEYVGKIYSEAKRRPKFIPETFLKK